jgi:1,4-dihydroxy-2-naphthoyl-CoA hydrolase
MSETGVDAAKALNEHRDGWTAANGLTFLRASGDEVVAELTVGPQHLQPYGIVHGGVHCGVIETLASVGGALHSLHRDSKVVGLENHTSFVRAVREGAHLTGVAKPLTRGRTTQVWEVSITGDDGKLVASGRVRLLCLPPDGLG